MATGSEFDHIPNGYAKLAAIQTKEQEYVILRRFRWLSARNLLYYQAEITALEYQLKFLEDRMRNECRTDVLRSWPTFAEDDTRCEIVLKIRQLLREYNTAMLQYKDLEFIPSPKPKHVGDLHKWLEIAEPIIDSSAHFLQERPPRGDPCAGQTLAQDYTELLSMNQRADSWIGNYLRHSFLKFFFASDMIYSPDRKEAFLFFASQSIDTLVTCISVVTAAILTVCAIMALSLTSGKGTALRMSLIGVFTSITACILALAGAKKSEVFIGTIGYVAVLVVFVEGPNMKN